MIGVPKELFMRIGGHFSISGGLNRSLEQTKEAEGNTVQIFSKNPGQWRGKEIDPKEAENFRNEAKAQGIYPVLVHDAYLINLATNREGLMKKSLAAFTDEIERAELIGAHYLVTHMGAHTGLGEDVSLGILADNVMHCIEQTKNSNVKVLLETTAGQGTQLGYKFEHIGRVMKSTGMHTRIGVCLDTCHIFAAGYDISTEEGYKRTIDSFDKEIGLKHLLAVHLNDAKKPCGSRVDRHEHIGQGFIGMEGFTRLINDPVFCDIPLILETPQPEKMHRVNIALLKGALK
ncbi:MAG: deoxyribonuclease IV [Firmicutes bacterium]|nr:deoxyribonuclease IV [Bacillota bacterium]